MTRVLLVGGDQPLSAALREAGAVVTDAPDAAAALDALEVAEFDCAVVASTPALTVSDFETHLVHDGHTLPVVRAGDRAPAPVVTAALERAETTRLAITRRRRRHARDLEADLRAALASCTDVAAVDRTACERLAESPLFRAAWVGRIDRDRGVVVPTAAAGLEVASLAEQAVGSAGTIAARVPLEWSVETRCDDDHVSVAVPVGDADPTGVLQVYADRPDGVDQAEATFLRSVGTAIGEARDRVAEEGAATETEGLAVLGETLAHELGNQLDAARVQLELARERDGGDHLGRVETALERIGDLASDASALAGGSLEPTDRPLAAAAEEAWAGVETDDATLSVTEGTVRADPAQFTLLLENLFRNAVEHGRPPRAADPIATSDGGESAATTDGDESALTVRVGPLDEGFYVADDGQGIPAAEREAVFEWGHSGGSSSGAGLGIVSLVAERHDWTITLTESDGGGARFEFRP